MTFAGWPRFAEPHLSGIVRWQSASFSRVVRLGPEGRSPSGLSQAVVAGATTAADAEAPHRPQMDKAGWPERSSRAAA